MEWTILSDQYVLLVAVLVLIVGMIIYQAIRKDKQHINPVLDIGEGSSIGNKESQEDAGGAAEAAWGTLTVLADGVGKEQAGKIAALTTVRMFIKLFTSYNVTSNVSHFFTQAFNQSNMEVLERLQGAKGKVAAGAVLVNKGHLYYASVGDIHIAILRNRELIAINDGHTMQSTATKGFSAGLLSREQALAISKIHRHTNYIGRDGFKNIEIGHEAITLHTGDKIILMNQGIYKSLSWLELEAILHQSYSCQQLAEQIIAKFNLKTMPDKGNASLFVLRYNEV